jgi:putative Holliday junction resolvase
MSQINHRYIALDVGEKRIGVAEADAGTRFPRPIGVVDVDGMEQDRLRELISEVQPTEIIVGYPRNQSGEPTKQTQKVVEFSKLLEVYQVPIVFQDESLTSVMAEDYLKKQKKPYSKADIDSHAAAIILGDFLEARYGY